MQKELHQPQLVKFTKKKVQVKDHDFYKGDDNLWNKFPHMDKKIYSQFHEQNLNKNIVIEQKETKEAEQNRRFMEQFRLRMLGNKKIEDKYRHLQRAEEREFIQSLSKQLPGGGYYSASVDSIDELVAKRNDATRFLRMNENVWNFPQGMTKKHIQQSLTPAVLKGEEFRIAVLKNSIMQEKAQEDYEKRKKSEFHQEIQEDMANRREQNMRVMKRLGILSQSSEKIRTVPSSMKAYSPEILRSNSKNLSSKQDKDSLTAFPDGFESSERIPSNALWTLKDESHERGRRYGPDIDRLSIPKKGMEKTFELASSDLKDSLIRNFDSKVFYPQNEFHQFLARKSQLYQETLTDVKITPRETREQRGSREAEAVSISKNCSLPPVEFSDCFQLTQPVQVTAKNQARILFNFEEEHQQTYEPRVITPIGSGPSEKRRDILDEMAAFEKKVKSKPKKIGYSRMDLEKSYKTTLSKNNDVAQTLQKMKEDEEEFLGQ